MLLPCVLPVPAVFGLWSCVVSSTAVLVIALFFTKIFQGEITHLQLPGGF